MKINFILPEMNLSGGMRVIAIYAKMLVDDGHSVFIISQPKKVHGRLAKLKTYGMADRGKKELKVNYFKELGLNYEVLDRPRDVRPSDLPDADITIATWWETAIPVAELPVSKGAKVYFMQDYGAPGQELEKLIPTFRLPLFIITISPWLQDLIYMCVNRPSHLALNGVDSDKFKFVKRKKNQVPTVGFCYRRSHLKGSDIMIEAARQIKIKHPEVRVVGFGPAAPSESIDVIDEGEFDWMIPEDKVSEFYSSCDVWMFGTRREGFGLPILEAMSCGTPVVATPAGASESILKKGGGALVEPESFEQMANECNSILEMTNSEWENLSKESSNIASTYTWESAYSQFLSGLTQARNES